MAPLTDQQTRFLTRYLGANLPDVDGDATANPVLPLWQQAKDAADSQLEGLSSVMRRTGDPDVIDVADEVATLLSPLRVTIVTALTEYDKAPGGKSQRKGALDAIGSARAWLGSDSRVTAVDSNPWEEAVSVADILGSALDRIEREITTHTGGTA